MKLSDMTKDEKSLLLFLETCAVDNGGLIDTRHMNEADDDIAKNWYEISFIDYGRIAFKSLEKLHSVAGRTYTRWVRLSEEAFQLAHEERIARAKRMFDKRNWKMAGE